jgi:hypothetical protein
MNQNTATRTGHPAATTPRAGWRTWGAAGLAALTAYSAAVGWQAQFVSYPLFRAVGPEEFAAYHLQYNDSIPFVVIAPGFLAFLGGIAFLWTRPGDVPRWVARVVAAGGLTSVLTTVLWAIPMHDRLDSIGQSQQVIDSLILANVPRTAALTVSTAVLLWALVRMGTLRPDTR